MTDRGFKVIAIVSVFNEADIIAQVVKDLHRQDVLVYVLDNGSTDQTREVLAPLLGDGLLAIEPFPPTIEEGSASYDWEAILRRKEALAAELDADWFIHHDADEFREGPWAHLTLKESIREVDTLGYNAIDFELLNFKPTHDNFRPGDDVRDAFPYYEFGGPFDKIQIRCWKKQTGTLVDLASTGGHEAIFPGRTVFPVRFILRHYPLRGQAHAEAKIFQHRRPRFRSVERERGWHVQYDQVQPGQRFVIDSATLRRYDATAVRLHLILNHRRVEELEATPDARRSLLESAKRVEARLNVELNKHHTELERLNQELDARNRDVLRLDHDLDARNRDVMRLDEALDARNRDVRQLTEMLDERSVQLDQLVHEVNRLRQAMATRDAELNRDRAQLATLLESRSWRWTAPLRRLKDTLLRRP